MCVYTATIYYEGVLNNEVQCIVSDPVRSKKYVIRTGRRDSERAESLYVSLVDGKKAEIMRGRYALDLFDFDSKNVSDISNVGG